ncbi:MAG TPA: ATP-binding protein, partial [Candidatus Methylomirabilis sp.]|nr:ATP-binding protein [Candidatus Methylomirabilis sp.]
RIRLETTADQLVLTVADSGRGITERELANRTSLGLLGMRERALLLGGQVTIAGRPGEGTTVTMQIPLSVCKGRIDSGSGESGQKSLPGATA